MIHALAGNAFALYGQNVRPEIVPRETDRRAYGTDGRQLGNNREVLTSPAGQGTAWADKFKTEGFISAIALRALCFCIVLESDDAAAVLR